MSKGDTKSSGVQSGSTAPLKGALAEEKDPNAIAMMMVLERLEGMEKERRLEAQAMQQALTATVDQVKTMQLEIARQKAATAEAMEALHGRMVELMEAKPKDPQTERQMIMMAQKEAKEEMQRRQAQFKEDLKTMKTGTIHNHTGQPKRFIINGVSRIIKPGINRKVPKSFVEAWKAQEELREWAAEVDRGFQSHEHMSDANTYNLKRGALPFWDEKVGKVG